MDKRLCALNNRAPISNKINHTHRNPYHLIIAHKTLAGYDPYLTVAVPFYLPLILHPVFTHLISHCPLTSPVAPPLSDYRRRGPIPTYTFPPEDCLVTALRVVVGDGSGGWGRCRWPIVAATCVVLVKDLYYIHVANLEIWNAAESLRSSAGANRRVSLERDGRIRAVGGVDTLDCVLMRLRQRRNDKHFYTGLFILKDLDRLLLCF